MPKWVYFTGQRRGKTVQEVAKTTKNFSLARRLSLKKLRQELGGKRIDPEVIRAMQKMARLSFAYSWGSCAGHLDLWYNPNPTRPRGFFYTIRNRPEFSISADNSENAKQFYAAFKDLSRRFRFIEVTGSQNEFSVFVNSFHQIFLRQGHCTLEQAKRLAAQKKVFLRAFEKIIERFLPSP